MTKKMNYTLWTIQILLAMLFLFTGSIKWILPVEELTKQIALPGWFLHFIGAAEIAAAIGLVARKELAPFAAAGLIPIMMGATILTAMTGDLPMALLPFVVGNLVAFVVWQRWPSQSDFRIERSARIDAPPERIIPLIDDFGNWSSWSPFEKLDPKMQRTRSGSSTGKGSVYEWSGNAKAGAGRMEILETTPSRVKIQLDFTRPFKGNNFAEFSLDPQGNSTSVKWAMYGPECALGKIMSAFIDRDRMVGRDFERGLATMKTVAENN